MAKFLTLFCLSLTVIIAMSQSEIHPSMPRPSYFPGPIGHPTPGFNPGIMGSTQGNAGFNSGFEPVTQLLDCYKALNSTITSLENTTRSFNEPEDLKNIVGLNSSLNDFIMKCNYGQSNMPNISTSTSTSKPYQLSCSDYITRIKELITSIFNYSGDFASTMSQITGLINIIPLAKEACIDQDNSSGPGFLSNNHPQDY